MCGQIAQGQRQARKPPATRYARNAKCTTMVASASSLYAISVDFLHRNGASTHHARIRRSEATALSAERWVRWVRHALDRDGAGDDADSLGGGWAAAGNRGR